jgi:hypothetical protein
MIITRSMKKEKDSSSIKEGVEVARHIPSYNY